MLIGSNNGAPKTGNLPSLKRQQSNNEDQTLKTNVRRWISLDDLTPPQSSEENSFVDYDSYLDDNVGSGSDNYIQPPAGEVKKEKKQKKKTKLPGESSTQRLLVIRYRNKHILCTVLY